MPFGAESALARPFVRVYEAASAMLLIRLGAGGDGACGAAPEFPRLTPPAAGIPPGVLALGGGGAGGCVLFREIGGGGGGGGAPAGECDELGRAGAALGGGGGGGTAGDAVRFAPNALRAACSAKEVSLCPFA